MYSRKDILDFAFRDALAATHTNGMDKDLIISVLTTSMTAYSEREGFNFTQEEIKSTIIAGLDTIEKAGEDFSHQHKMMY